MWENKGNLKKIKFFSIILEVEHDKIIKNMWGKNPNYLLLCVKNVKFWKYVIIFRWGSTISSNVMTVKVANKWGGNTHWFPCFLLLIKTFPMSFQPVCQWRGGLTLLSNRSEDGLRSVLTPSVTLAQHYGFWAFSFLSMYTHFMPPSHRFKRIPT